MQVARLRLMALSVRGGECAHMNGMARDLIQPLDAQIILLSIGDAVIEIGKEKRVNIFNRAAERITGLKAQEVIGRPYHEVICFATEDSDTPRYEFIEEVLREGEENLSPKKAAILTRDGKKIPITASAAPVKGEDGTIIGAVVIMRDVTKERELENIKLEFLSLASHQLRTPLSGMKWLIETIMAEHIGKLTPEQKEYLNFIYKSNERMIKLVNDLLSLIRLEGEGAVIETSTFSLNEFLRECREFSKIAAEKYKIHFSYEPWQEDTAITSDRTILKTILDIFVSNAVNYSKEGGEIILAARDNGEFVEFSVKDNGIGVPKEERNKIFAKFYRASNAKMAKPEGAGLGLYIAKFLSDAIGGVIRVESIEDQGSTFYLMIPLRPKSFVEKRGV